MAVEKRYCPGCEKNKVWDEENFCRDKDGWRSLCRVCYNERRRNGESTNPRVHTVKSKTKTSVTTTVTETSSFQSTAPDDDAEKAAADRARRIASDFEHIKPEDFDTSVGNDGRIDPRAAKEKRQEFSRAMGEFAQQLRESQGDPDILPPEMGTYIGALAEQERRFGNRRIARSISLIAAHEELSRRLFKQAADTYLKDKVTPTGYALKDWRKPIKRTVVAHFSDLHLGADLTALDNPIPFRAVEEARRLEYFVRQVMDFKPQYRETSELVMLLNGDLIEGLLLHDLRDGIPLTEQKVVFWRYFRVIIGLFAQTFPKVRVVCQPGNHGRDKIRHPGRATSSKWDGHEWEMMYALAQMCSGLRNVTFDNSFMAVASVQLFDSWMLVTHGDTEIKFGDPDTKAKENFAIVDGINNQLTYGHKYAVVTAGHFHKGRYQPHGPDMIFNGALVPSNGHARSSGYTTEKCGQWIWEAVEGHPVGDLRFIKVGPAQDHDEKLGKLIQPFRFSLQQG